MASDAGSGPDLGVLEAHLVVTVGRVGVGENPRIGSDDGIFADGDAAAIVEQRTLADRYAVFDDEVVAVREVDAVVDADARTHLYEQVAAEHAAEAQPQPVFQPDGRAVEHL